MEPLKIALPPGLSRQGTEYQNTGVWYEASMIRWADGVMRPIPGWTIGLPGATTGNVRAAHAWKDNDGVAFALIGTHSGLWIHEGTDPDDVTPSGFAAGDADASAWTLDNLGELGVACNDSTGYIYEYQPGGAGLATVITNAPTASAVFVTEERFIVAVGSDDDPRRIAWCDQENRTVWAPTATNQAGDKNLQSVGVGICGAKIPGGALVWTDADVHQMRYVGMPDVYGFERKAQNCGIYGRRAFMVVDSVAYWMGPGGFFIYAGYVEPIPCSIRDYVFDAINTAHAHKVWCWHNARYGEVWFFYPRDAATECSHAAIYNYRERHWSHTPMTRVAGFDASVFGWPVMFTSGGRGLKHETGYDYEEGFPLTADDGTTLLYADDGTTALYSDPYEDGTTVAIYAVSGPFEVGNGDRRLQLDEIIPDEQTQGDCEVSFYMRERPNATETTLGPYNAADEIGVYTTARQIRLEIRAETGAGDFRVGTYRARVKARGRY